MRRAVNAGRFRAPSFMNVLNAMQGSPCQHSARSVPTFSGSAASLNLLGSGTSSPFCTAGRSSMRFFQAATLGRPSREIPAQDHVTVHVGTREYNDALRQTKAKACLRSSESVRYQTQAGSQAVEWWDRSRREVHLPRHERTPAGPHTLLSRVPLAQHIQWTHEACQPRSTGAHTTRRSHAPSRSWRCLRWSTCPCQALPGTRGPPAPTPAPATWLIEVMPQHRMLCCNAGKHVDSKVLSQPPMSTCSLQDASGAGARALYRRLVSLVYRLMPYSIFSGA